MKKKLKLDDLKLESFLTELDKNASNNVNGGVRVIARTDHHGCCKKTTFECLPETADCAPDEPYVSYTCV